MEVFHGFFFFDDFLSNIKSEEVNMIQEKAKQLIKDAVEKNVQDIYIVPKKEHYEIYQRVGDERQLSKKLLVMK